MKKLKQIFNQIKALKDSDQEDITDLLWQLICYSPKMPVRLQQQQLLNEAETFSLQVDDPHFSRSALNFSGFIWGDGSRKVLITHGWGSKVADFTELITALRTIDNLQIIAFDAPGNGSSEGELSNLILFAKAAQAIINTYGAPDVMIGHSLGAAANVIAIDQTGIKLGLLISIAPLIRLKENFIATMNAAEVSPEAQVRFFESFESLFNVAASYFNLTDLYKDDVAVKHWLAHDHEDKIAPYPYLQEFLNAHPDILTKAYMAVGHERIIKDTSVIEDILRLIK